MSTVYTLALYPPGGGEAVCMRGAHYRDAMMLLGCWEKAHPAEVTAYRIQLDGMEVWLRSDGSSAVLSARRSAWTLAGI